MRFPSGKFAQCFGKKRMNTDAAVSGLVIGAVVYSYICLFNVMMHSYKESGYTTTLFDFIRETYVGSFESRPSE
jgi:hypothetical protein